VKQPLPLPQGVSDYAVGGRCAALKSAPTAPAYHSRTLSREVMSGVVREKKEPEAMVETAAVEEAEVSMLKLASVSCTGGLSEDDVRAVVEKALHALKRCGGSGRVTFSLTVDPGGEVIRVALVKGPDMGQGTLRCMIQTLETLRFSKLPGKTKAEVTLVFLKR
ncbi:MAG: hypothetical protein JRF65_15640, partial [Deltaproteobacteria bacterium]|nr:hypothetical protein [Deltaproteobacteria bacterium]